MHFLKMEGLGNDFIVTDDLPEADESTLIASASRLCDRRRGIGADGLVVVLPSRSADYRMRIINSDGSEAEMCGNGIRCCANYIAQYLGNDSRELSIETLAGVIGTRRLEDGMVRVNMRPPILEPSLIPVAASIPRLVDYPLVVGARTFTITAVSMGNPHVVHYSDLLTDDLVCGTGPEIEHHPLFPKKTNVEFATVLSRSEVRMRVWERGCGETEACGTGACAVAVAGILNGYHEPEVTVHLPGGDLFIKWQGGSSDSVYMTGPARTVFSGNYELKQMVYGV